LILLFPPDYPPPVPLPKGETSGINVYLLGGFLEFGKRSNVEAILESLLHLGEAGKICVSSVSKNVKLGEAPVGIRAQICSRSSVF
jgi:hypothetical protein